MPRNTIDFRRLALAASLVCLLLLPGCVKTTLTPHPPGNAPGGRSGQAAQLFTPMESYRVQRLSQSEALTLTRKLSPRSQGLRSWKDMEYGLEQSLAFVSHKPAQSPAIQRQDLTVTWGQLAETITVMKKLAPRLDADPSLLASNFDWVRIGPDFSFTGYYEPTLAASRTPTAKLSSPLYRTPPDLRRGRPYHTRQAIDRHGVLKGKKLEIAWVDPTEAYFLHVQGSGRLRYPDGSITHILYADKNNRKYVSLGRVMREQGLLAENNTNMKAIRAYLAANPHQRAELFDENPSYVFFREDSHGPLGSMGKPLTPWVSLAVDRRVIAQGALAFVMLPLPDESGTHTQPFYGLTLPQDSGGAIKGHRIDLFCGGGDNAEHIAGHLDVKGAVYILLARKH